MKSIRITSRPSDGRIELTNIIKNYTDSVSMYFNVEPNGRIAIYRHSENGYINSHQIKSPNIEDRFFYTPSKKKSYHTVSIGRNYIYVS